MNLIDLKRKVRELTAFINYQRAEIDEQRNTVKAIKYEKEMIKGTSKRHDTSDVIAKIVEMEKDVEQAEKEYNRLIPLINELEKGYKELNERDKLIYLERYIKGYSFIKIGIIHGITDRQVRNILNSINSKINDGKKPTEYDNIFSR